MLSDYLAHVMYASAVPFGVMALTSPDTVDAYRVAKWRTLRWSANRAFALARALNRAKNDAHRDACE